LAMKDNPLLDPKILAKLCADLSPILKAEIAKRNRVTEASRGYPGAVNVWLSSPFRTKPAKLPAHVVHRDVNDPHYWLAEYSCTKHNHFLACGFGRQSK
jgi:hypothetical protein